jgi:hypothetical protein
VVAGSLAAGPVAADTSSTHIVKVITPVIEIENDGQHYTKPAVALAQIAASANVALDAEISGRIKSFKVWLKFRSETSNWADFPEHGHAETFPLHERPKSLNNDFFLSIPYGAHASYLVAYCNLQANALRHGGMSNTEIFAQDRPLQVGLLSALEYEMSGANGRVDTTGIGGGWDSLAKMTVVCKAKDPERSPVANDPARDKPEVKAAGLDIHEKSSLQGACRLTLVAQIETVEPTTQVQFRFESDAGDKSDVKQVITDSVGKGQYAFDYPLAPGGTRTGKIRIRGVGENFGSEWEDYEVQCGSPAQDVATVLAPKAVAVEAYATAENVMYRGLVCPAKAKVWGVMMGRGDVQGGVAVLADGQMVLLQQYQAEVGKDVVVQAEHALNWEGNQTGQQSVHYRMNITNGVGDLVDHIEKSWSFECKKPQVSGAVAGGPGGIATGQNTPLPAQQQRPQAATGQIAVAPALAIVAPKGVVRSGEIRLSGASPTAVYKLTFLRRSGSGYTAVNAAQLPKQMKGPTATFPLAALAGGRAWRLQVCPVGAAASACETSDFRVALMGAKKEDQSGGSAPTTTIIVVPGLSN